jgi:hypothetical protein
MSAALVICALVGWIQAFSLAKVKNRLAKLSTPTLLFCSRGFLTVAFPASRTHPSSTALLDGSGGGLTRRLTHTANLQNFWTGVAGGNEAVTELSNIH